MGYNGINNKYYKRKEPIAWKKQKETLYRLSDNFISQEPEKGMPVPENSIELVVKMINICYNKDAEVLKKSRTMNEYSRMILPCKRSDKDMRHLGGGPRDGHQEMQGRKRADGISAKIRRRRCTKC